MRPPRLTNQVVCAKIKDATTVTRKVILLAIVRNATREEEGHREVVPEVAQMTGAAGETAIVIEIETEIVKLADATEAEAVAAIRGEIVAGPPAHHIHAHFLEIDGHDLAHPGTDHHATVTTDAKETRAEAVIGTIAMIVTVALAADAGRDVTAAAAKAATITTKRRMMVTTRRLSSNSSSK